MACRRAGEATRTNGDAFRFAFCDVFTFAAGDEICRVESYLVPLK